MNPKRFKIAIFEDSRRSLLDHATVFFLYGAIVHLFLFRLAVRHAYLSRPEPSFTHDPLVYAIVVLTGGASVTWLMLTLLQTVRPHDNIHRLRAVLRGGFFGIAATVLTFAGSSLLGAALFSVRISDKQWLRPILFILGTTEIGTYAMAEAITIIPYAFLYGALGGVYVVVFSGKPSANAALMRNPLEYQKLSVTFGILGLLFVLIPFVGFILAGLAILFGIRARREKGITGSTPTTQATLGIILGSLCAGFWVFSVAVYIAATYGWLGNR